MFDAAGLEQRPVCGVEDFATLPLLTKDVVRRSGLVRRLAGTLYAMWRDETEYQASAIAALA